MPITTKTGIPFPSENQDPFYEQFVGMVEALDASLYAGREDRQVVLSGGGSFTFTINGTTGIGTLTWGSTISIAAPLTGLGWEINVGSVDLLEGEAAHVNLPRSPLSNVAVTLLSGSQIPSSDSDFVIGVRRSSRFYFRNGRVIKDGDTVNVLETGSVGATGQVLYVNLPIAVGKTTALFTNVTAGDYVFSRNQYLLTGTTTTTKFKTVAFMAGAPGVAGEIWLWDLTASAIVAGSTVSVSALIATEQLVPVTLNVDPHRYEVRMRVTVGPASIYCQWAGIEVLNTF